MSNPHCERCELKRFFNLFRQLLNVDKFTKQTGAVAAVFVRQGENFVRVSTTTINEEGKRAIGSFLDRNGGAYKSLINGQKYTGEGTLFGKEYFVKYAPLITEDENRVVVALGIAILK